MARKIGTDYGIPGKAALDAAVEVNQQGFNTLLGLNQNFSQATASMTESQIASNDAIAKQGLAVANVIGEAANYRAQNFKSFTDTVAQGLMQEREFQGKKAELEEKRRKEQLQALSEEEFANAYVEVFEYAASADSYIAQSNPRQFVNDGMSVLQKYQNLSPAHRRSLTELLYGSVSRVNQNNFQKAERTQEELQSGVRAAHEERLTIVLGSITGRIKAGNGNINELLDDGEKIIGEYLFSSPDLDTIDKIKIYAGGLKMLAGASEQGFHHQAEINSRVSNLNALITDPEFVNLQQEYAAGNRSKNYWNAQVRILAAKHDISVPDVESIGDPNATEEELLRIQEMREKRKKLIDQGRIDSASNIRLETSEVAALGWYLYSDEIARKRVEDSPFAQSPDFKAAAELANKIKDYSGKVVEVNQRVLQLNQMRAEFNLGQINRQLSQGQGNQSTMELWELMKAQFPDRDIVAPPQTRPEMSPEERQQAIEAQKQFVTTTQNLLIQRIAAEQDSLSVLKSELARYGLLDSNGKVKGVDNVKAIVEGVWQEVDLVYKEYEDTLNQTGQTGLQGNFNSGGSRNELATSKVAFAKATTYRTGKTMLLPFYHNAKITVNQHRGEAGEHLNEQGATRNRPHAGLDILAPIGTPIVSHVSGTVVRNAVHDGYGNTLDIKTSTGTVWRFAHLNTAAPVKVGQTVKVGDVIAQVGNTGRSSAPHLHLEARSSQGDPFGYANSYNVEAILSDLQEVKVGGGRQARSNSTQPSQVTSSVPDDSIPIQVAKQAAMAKDMIHYLRTGEMIVTKPKPLASNQAHKPTPGNPVPASAVYNNVNPLQGKYARSDKAAWSGKNKPDANYGYAVLGRNPKWTKKLNEISDRLNIPAQWLADIIAHESGWIPDRDNGVGYKGFIQFGGHAAAAIGLDRSKLSTMPGEQQLEYVYKYLNQPEFRGKLKTIAHVLGAIWAGGGVQRGGKTIFQMLDENPKSTLNIGDGWIKFDEYLKRLGRDVGRQYSYPYLNGRTQNAAPVVHRTPVAGCPVCNSLNASKSFVHHEAQS